MAMIYEPFMSFPVFVLKATALGLALVLVILFLAPFLEKLAKWWDEKVDRWWAGREGR